MVVMTKIKTILQSEAAECGLTSLAMIANAHGFQIDLNTLRQRYPQTLKGIDLLQLTQIADELKLSSRALQLEMFELPQLQLPCILHWDMNHFVVLEKVSKTQVVIHDPAIGKRTLTLEETAKHFTGVALELSPASDFKKEDQRVQVKLKQFWQSARGLKPILLQLVLLSLVLEVFTLATPYYMQLVLDDVVTSYDTNLLTILALGFGLLTLFKVATTCLRSFVTLHMGVSLNQQFAFNLFRHLMRLPQDFFAKRHIGDVVSRFGSLDQIQTMITDNLVEAIIDGLMAIATLIMLFLYSPKLACVVLAAMALYFGIRMAWFPAFRAVSEEGIIANAKEDSNFMENIRGMQTIKLAGIEAKRQTLWQNLYIEKQNLHVRSSKLTIFYQVANGLLFGLEGILVTYMGAMLIIEPSADKVFTVGMLTAFMAYKNQLTTSFASLIDKFFEFKMLSLHLERLADIALTETEADLETVAQPKVIVGKIGIKNLHYQYAPSEPVLFQGLSYEFVPGESVAIVGPSGCGKSTLVKILLGLYQPSTGAVMIDGQELGQLGKRNYRRQVGSVMQDDELLSGSLADNISQFDPQIDIERVQQCAQMAAIDAEIQAMPMGYNSLVGDMGTTLSGGQKQRVLLARALYQQPKILFLDEATSHLDVGSEHRVNDAIAKLKITRIVVAHRPETIAMADRVLELRGNQLHDITRQLQPPKTQVPPTKTLAPEL
jgi:ATP-binding cassette subfamily B protein RaxB